MAVTLPAIGTITYTTSAGTVTFGPMTETLGIRGRPVRDRSGRVIVYIVWTISLKTVIAATPPTTTDASIETIRTILSRDRGELVYSDKGFDSDFSINTGNVKDVNYGPKIVSLEWKPIASAHVVEVLWSVEVAIPECENARYEKALAEVSYSVSYDIDMTGHTKRSLRGFFRIAANTDGRFLTDNADKYREKLASFAVPTTFRRTDRGFQLHEDKASMTVTVVDEQLRSPNVPPPGCIKARLSHTIANGSPTESGVNLTTQIGTISAKYTMARGFPASIAAQHFRKVIQDRVWRLKGEFKKDIGPKTPPQTIGAIVALHSSITEEDAFDLNEVRLSFQYLMTTSPTMLMSKGLWRPMPNANGPGVQGWDVWAQSMDRTWSARGHAGLAFDNKDDAIIDLCLGEARMGGRRPPVNADRPALLKQLDDIVPYPDPEASWITIQTAVKLEPQDRVLRHVPLESGTNRLRTPALIRSDSLANIAAMKSGSSPIFQPSAASAPVVIFYGYAVRAGWEIECPKLLGAYGRAALPANAPGYGFVQISNPRSGPVPITVARWCLRYFLSDEPINIPGGWQAPLPKKDNAQPQVEKQWTSHGDAGWSGDAKADMPLYATDQPSNTVKL